MGELTKAVLDAALAASDGAARAVMRLSVLDWAAVALAGRDEPVARIVRRMVLDEGGRGEATLVGGGRGPARAAALVNGTVSHALDYDDTHFAHIGHPSVAVVPAALAVAEAEGADLDRFLDSALAGCEASIRFGLVLGREHYQRGFHQTATAGAFGAAVAAGRLLGLAREGLAHAIGIASTRAAGLKSQFGTMGKPYNAGQAAQTGVEAARLAALGLVSNLDGFDGPQGFVETHHGAAAATVPEGFLMTGVSHKFHACCHGLHAALEALARLGPPDPAAVAELIVTTHPRWLRVCNIAEPRTGLEAKFSYRAALALALLGHDTARPETFSDRNATAPDMRALAARVRVETDERLPETAARVRIPGIGEAAHDLADLPPLDERTRRVRAKAAVLLGTERAEALWAALQAAGQPAAAFTRLLA